VGSLLFSNLEEELAEILDAKLDVRFPTGEN